MLGIFRSTATEIQNRAVEWPEFLLLVQSVLINTPCAQCVSTCPVKCFTGLDTTCPIATCYRSSLPASVSIPDVDRERILDCEQLCRYLADLQPVVYSAYQKCRKGKRNEVIKNVVKESAAKLVKVVYLILRKLTLFSSHVSIFVLAKKLSLRRSASSYMIRPVDDYIYQIDDLRNLSKTGMEVQRLM